MNRIKLLKELENSFESFIIHPELITDLTEIISNSGAEKSFLSKLKYALNFLKRYGITAHIQPTSQFEKLMETTDLFSMHIEGKAFNVRIIYSFADDGTILLHGFYERQGKRATDYSSAVPTAQRRKAEMENDNE